MSSPQRSSFNRSNSPKEVVIRSRKSTSAEIETKTGSSNRRNVRTPSPSRVNIRTASPNRPTSHEVKKMSFKQLPPEIKGKVRSFLTSKEYVSVSQSETELYRIMQMFPLDLSFMNMTAEQFKKYFSGREKANIVGLTLNLDSSSLDFLTPFCPRLRKLSINKPTRMNTTPVNLEPLATCFQLVELNLYKNFINAHVLVNCPNLSQIKFVHISLKSDISFLSECKNLTQIEADLYDNSKEMIKYIANLKLLRSIKMHSCSYYGALLSLRECAALREFSVEYCSSLLNIEGLTGCTNLMKCSVKNCVKIVDFSPLSSCTNLEDITLHCRDFLNRGPVINLEIFSKLLNLKRLDLKNCSFTDTASLEDFLALEELSLNEIGNGVQIPILPRVSFLESENKVTGLKVLSFENMLLDELPELDYVSELRKIKMIRCEILTNIDFIRDCFQLIELDIVQCPILSLEFIANCQLLESFSFTGRTKYNSNEYIDLSPLIYCKSLKKIHLGDNHRPMNFWDIADNPPEKLESLFDPNWKYYSRKGNRMETEDDYLYTGVEEEYSD